MFTFTDVSKDTRNGFYHKSTLYFNGVEIASARVSYLNRTWEAYTFQTSRESAVRKALKLKSCANLRDQLNQLLSTL